MKQRKVDLRLLGLIAVIVLDLLVVAILSKQIVNLSNYPFDSDEALHASRGLELTFDLQRGDIGAFLRHSNQQSVYPPGSSWFEALTFLLFGASTTTARLYSLASLFGATIVMYAIGLELDRRNGWLAGLIAVILTLTGQAVLIGSALAMLELPGLLVSFAAFLAYLKATRHSSSWLFVVTSLLLILAVLIKYPYGIVVIGSIGLAELINLAIERPVESPRSISLRWLLLFGPLVLGLVLWFMGDQKFDDFLYYATLQPKQTEWNSLDNLVFYPRSFALHYAPAAPFALLSLASMAWATIQWRRSNLRLILLYSLLGLLLMTFKESNNPRFILTVAPAVHLLTGAMLADLAAKLVRSWPRIRPGLAIATIVVGLIVLASLPTLVERYCVLPSLLKVEYETDPRAGELAAWIADQTNGQRLYFINPWDQFSTYAMEWYQATQGTAQYARFGDLYVPGMRLQSLTPERLEELEFQIRFYSTDFVVAFEGGLEGQQIWPEYEQGFADILLPVASREINLDYYPVGDRFKSTAATRASLEQAMSESYLPLHIKVSIYKLIDEDSIEG
jgi:hypothetical protein